MSESDQLAVVGEIVECLRRAGFEPVLVGGMALIIMGSRRVTHDYDFVIAHPGEKLQDVLDAFYDRGFELVSRVNDDGDVIATIDNRRIASVRIRLDEPDSVYFFNHATRLRMDLLFDFPIPAAELMKHATRMKVRSQVLEIASPADLLRLKELARAARSFAGDAQDIEFLKRHLNA